MALDFPVQIGDTMGIYLAFISLDMDKFTTRHPVQCETLLLAWSGVNYEQ